MVLKYFGVFGIYKWGTYKDEHTEEIQLDALFHCANMKDNTSNNGKG